MTGSLNFLYYSSSQGYMCMHIAGGSDQIRIQEAYGRSRTPAFLTSWWYRATILTTTLWSHLFPCTWPPPHTHAHRNVKLVGAETVSVLFIAVSLEPGAVQHMVSAQKHSVTGWIQACRSECKNKKAWKL